MKALVTGANGFVGSHLVRELVARGHTVRALALRGSDVSTLDVTGGLEIVEGDVTDEETLSRAVPGCDTVFHLAGIRRAADRATFMSINADATRLLLEACLRAGAAGHRFVLAGSRAALGPSREGRREEDPFEPAEWYGESKAEAERIALSYADRIPVSIARPPRIMGPGDHENLLFFRIVARGFVVRILGPDRPLSWIDVEDCAKGFILLAERSEAVGESFFLASRERTSIEGLQWEVARALGTTPRVIPIPPFALTAAGGAADLFTRLTGKKLPLNRKLARQVLAIGWTCEIEKAERILGFSATTTLSDSISRSASFYRQRGWL